MPQNRVGIPLAFPTLIYAVKEPSMLGLPKDEWLALAKKTLTACEGNVRSASEILGIKYNALSEALNRGQLALWWVPYKRRLMLERTQARYRRANHRRKVRQFLEVGVPYDLAEELASRRAPRDGWGEILQCSLDEAQRVWEAEAAAEAAAAAPRPRGRPRGRRKGARKAPRKRRGAARPPADPSA